MWRNWPIHNLLWQERFKEWKVVFSLLGVGAWDITGGEQAWVAQDSQVWPPATALTWQWCTAPTGVSSPLWTTGTSLLTLSPGVCPARAEQPVYQALHLSIPAPAIGEVQVSSQQKVSKHWCNWTLRHGKQQLQWPGSLLGARASPALAHSPTATPASHPNTQQSHLLLHTKQHKKCPVLIGCCHCLHTAIKKAAHSSQPPSSKQKTPVTLPQARTKQGPQVCWPRGRKVAVFYSDAGKVVFLTSRVLADNSIPCLKMQKWASIRMQALRKIASAAFEKKRATFLPCGSACSWTLEIFKR